MASRWIAATGRFPCILASRLGRRSSLASCQRVLTPQPAFGSVLSAAGSRRAFAASEGSSASASSESGDGSKSDSDGLPDESNESLFSESWWPDAADQCFQRLAGRPQLLPEDPLAHGIVSFVEYELACKPLPARKASEKTGKADGAQKGDDENQTVRSQQDPDEPLTPLERDGSWRWMLYGTGEIVGAKGEPRGGSGGG
eukprot:TRINITY_DN20414_c0_g1_i1.p1 TRINITY_DN20414_c0_g1~~TRINITY_DN20414_c0_g1_i1.p1  ORF type:complete len:214 (-),score=26.30 TRINITY_DN20414_c0_g1_i1:57-656(-)